MHATSRTCAYALLEEGVEVRFYSPGGLTNIGTAVLKGKVTGTDSGPSITKVEVENSGTVKLGGDGSCLVADVELSISNKSHEAKVIINYVQGILSVLNSIDPTNSDTATIIKANHFQVKGLTIESVTTDGGVANDLSGTVSIGSQIKDFTSEDDFKAHRVIEVLGNTTVKDELSSGLGVSIQVGRQSKGMSLFLIEGTLSTQCGDIVVNGDTATYYCSNHLENVRFTVTGEYRAIGGAFLFDRAVKAEFAKFDIKGGSISTTLKEAMRHEERLDRYIWLRGNTLIDDNYQIPKDVELVVLNDIKVDSGNRLTVNGVLSLGFEEWMNINGTKEPVYGRLVLNNSADIVINGVLSSRVKESSTDPNVCDTNGDKLTIPGAYYAITDNNMRTIYLSSLTYAIDSIDPAVGRTIELRGAVSFMDGRDLPAGSRIHVANGAELVVGGNLAATAAGSKITLDGSIRVIDKGLVKTIEVLDGKFDAVMYSTREGSETVYNYVSPDSISGGSTEYEISGKVTISTPIEGNLKFIGNGVSDSTVTIYFIP